MKQQNDALLKNRKKGLIMITALLATTAFVVSTLMTAFEDK